MKRILRIIFGLALLGLFVWTLWYLYQKSQKPAVTYSTASPVIADIVKKTVATGAVVPRKEILIKPQVSGIIEEIYIEPGKQIKKGDLIAKIQIIPDVVNLNNAESRLSRARINYNQSQTDLNRARELYANKAIALTDLQQAELAFKNAKEELEAANNNLELIKKGAVGKTGNTLVRSTISGMVLDVPVKEGNSVIESNTFNEGTTIASVADMNDLIFEGYVDESEVGKLKAGMDLILTIGAIEDEHFPAKLEYIAPKGAEVDGAIQFQIRAAVKQPENRFIRAGYSANADIVLARADSVLAIEERLLQFEGQKPFVEIETGPQQFEKRFISTGLSDGIMIEIKEGISQEVKIKNPQPDMPEDA